MQAKYLKSAQEICVNHERQGEVAQLVAEVLELQVDPSPSVRKSLLDLCDAVLQIKVTVTILQLVLSCTLHFLRDTTSNTVKRAIVSAFPAYRAAVAVIIDRNEDNNGELLNLWEIATAVKDEVAQLSGSTTTGVRLSAGKFLEQAILLLTADALPKVPGLSTRLRKVPIQGDILSRSGLNQQADALVGILLGLIKRIGTENANTSAAIWIRTCKTLINQRPQFIGRLLPQLLGLTSYVSTLEKVRTCFSFFLFFPFFFFLFFRDRLIDSLRKLTYLIEYCGQENTVRSAVVDSLVAVLNSEHSLAIAWKARVQETLTIFGSDLEIFPEKERQR